MKKLTARQADLMLFFVAFFWGTGFSVTKAGLQYYTISQLLFLRFGIAAIVSIAVFRNKIRKITKSDLKAGLIMGVLLAFGYIFQTVGLEGTTTGNSAFLTSSSVVIVPFFFWIVTRKKPGRNNIISAVLMFAGIILLTVDFDNFGKFNKWDFLTFIGSILFAWQLVATGIFAEDKDPAVISTLQIATSAVIFMVMTVVERKTVAFSVQGTLSMGYLSLVTTMLCFLMQTTGQKYTSTTHAAIILSLESVIGSIIGVIFLNEKYSSLTIVAYAVIFAAILAAELGFEWILKIQRSR
ncbi:MAG: DMT family transporter [Sedimentibacter sp.]|uniref:DMT family transporter n=1 Tax=Sedimentibacter sp. TaxID=1960295 RepID=UPI0031597460